MKKSILIPILIAFVFPFEILKAQDMTETQRQERCQNNKNRLAELRNQSATIEETLSKTINVDDARTKIAFVRKLKSRTEVDDGWLPVFKIAKQYNFKFTECYSVYVDDRNIVLECLTKLENVIAQKIQNSLTLNEDRAELLRKKTDIDNQIAYHRKNLTALGCDEFTNTIKDLSGDAVIWEGTYKGGYWTFTLTGNSSVLSGTFKYVTGDAKGSGTLFNCKVQGNTVSGNWEASHEDTDKTGTRNGTFTGTVIGNSFSGQLLEDTPSPWNWKPGRFADYTSKMTKGAIWPFDLVRQ